MLPSLASLTINQIGAIIGLLIVGGRVSLMVIAILNRAEQRHDAQSKLDSNPVENESRAAEVIGKIRRLTADHFGLNPALLTPEVDLTGGLRIPRGDLDRFIEDLEEDLHLSANMRSVGHVQTFSDLLTLFVPARLQHSSMNAAEI